MGSLLTAFQNKTPLIVTAGQQTREMLLLEPWLTNVEATTLPRPWVKWAYEPSASPRCAWRVHAGDRYSPAAAVGACVPVAPARRLGEAVRGRGRRAQRRHARRTGSRAPERVRQCDSPGILPGPDLRRGCRARKRMERGGRAGGGAGCPGLGSAGLGAHPVPGGPPALLRRVAVCDGAAGQAARGTRRRTRRGRPGVPLLPLRTRPISAGGLRLLHISDDPAETARAPVGDSLLADAVLSLTALKEQLGGHVPSNDKPRQRVEHRMASHPAPAGTGPATAICPPRKCSAR